VARAKRIYARQAGHASIIRQRPIKVLASAGQDLRSPVPSLAFLLWWVRADRFIPMAMRRAGATGHARSIGCL
jgi:hypothetical protein